MFGLGPRISFPLVGGGLSWFQWTCGPTVEIPLHLSSRFQALPEDRACYSRSSSPQFPGELLVRIRVDRQTDALVG